MESSSTVEDYVLPSFSGSTGDIRIEAWLMVYERIAENCRWNDKDKKQSLFRYFKGEAFEYLAMEDQEASFEKIKANLILRFGKGAVDPAILFSRVIYKPEIGIQTYFNEKRRFGVQAKTPENVIVSLMIDGLPFDLKQVFAGLRVKEMAEFFSIAQTAELNLKEKVANASALKPSTSGSERKREIFTRPMKAKKIPPNPCNICKELGYPGRYHWMSDCRNKGKKNLKRKNIDKPLN